MKTSGLGSLSLASVCSSEEELFEVVNNEDFSIDDTIGELSLSKEILTDHEDIPSISNTDSDKVGISKIDAKLPAALSNVRLNEFASHGYLIVEDCVPSAICDDFNEEVVQPLLRELGLEEAAPTKYVIPGATKEHIFFNTKNVRAITGDELSGVWLGLSDETDVTGDERWERLFDPPCLVDMMNHIHGTSVNWKWQRKLRGINIRFPVVYSNSRSVIPSSGWSAGIHHSHTCKLHSPHVSVSVHMVIRDVPFGGGSIAVIKGSQHAVARWLRNKGENGVSPRRLHDFCNFLGRSAAPETIIQIAPLNAGDAILLHPFTVFAPCFNSNGKPFSIQLDLPSRWSSLRSPLSYEKECAESAISTLRDRDDILRLCHQLLKQNRMSDVRHVLRQFTEYYPSPGRLQTPMERMILDSMDYGISTPVEFTLRYGELTYLTFCKTNRRITIHPEHYKAVAVKPASDYKDSPSQEFMVVGLHGEQSGGAIKYGDCVVLMTNLKDTKMCLTCEPGGGGTVSCQRISKGPSQRFIVEGFCDLNGKDVLITDPFLFFKSEATNGYLSLDRDNKIIVNNESDQRGEWQKIIATK